MNKKIAFTLIELLVVIAIMSTLAAFLLPALTKARAKAKYARWQAYSHTLEADPELVAYYNFEKGSGPTLYNKGTGFDRRGYKQEKLDGTLKGDAQWTTTNGRWPGKGAIEFDGSGDYVTCGNDSSVNITDVITIEAWVKGDDFPVAQCAIVGRTTAGAGGAGYVLSVYNATPRFYVSGDRPVAPSISTGQWHHIVGTFDKDLLSNNIKIYVDGVFKAETTRITAITIINEVCIASATNSGVQSFNGTIDEVAIYSSALSAGEIAKHYQMGKP